MDQLKSRLPTHVYDSLINAQLKSLASIIALTKSELAQTTQLDLSHIELITRESANVVINNKLRTADEIPSWRKISTGCPPIDAITRGGVAVNGITEIVGSSGVGKTQFCLQLSLVTQLPAELGGLGKNVVYICTEDVFPIRRLSELAGFFRGKYHDVTHFEDNIFIEHAADFEQLRRCLFVRLPKLLTVKNVGLVVIDSIAGVFRSENFEVNYTNRSQDFVSLVSKLNKLSSRHGFAVICVNQVTDNVGTGNTEPCLGLAWSNLITHRFNISRHTNSQTRECEVVFAPDLPNQTCKFKISKEGLVEI